MISPLAPLFPWLLSAVMFDTPMCVRPNGRARLVGIQRTCANGPTQYKFAEHRATWTSETPTLDLRHGPTRYAVLRALADAGHPRPWALGAPWSPLTDEQAGRVTAEIVRAVGADPKKPVGVVPVCVLGPWFWPIPHVIGRSCGMSARDSVVGDMDRIRVCEAPSMAAGWRSMGTGGPETGEPGRTP